MKYLFYVLIVALCFAVACKSNVLAVSDQPIPKFPKDWLGTYEGTLRLIHAERGTFMELPMVVRITTTDTPNCWRWYSKSVYKGKEIIKDYALVRHDTMPTNHYLVDENNGIYLDRVLLGDGFYDYFEVGNTGFCGITRKVGDDLHFEIASFSLTSKTYSVYQGTDFDVDTIASYKVVNTQKVLLKRIKTPQ